MKSLRWALLVLALVAIFAGLGISWREGELALRGGDVVKFNLASADISLFPGVRPGDKLNDLKVTYSSSRKGLIDFSKDSWAQTSGTTIRSLGGAILYSKAQMIARAGDKVQLVVTTLGYPHRVVTTTNGADFLYFVEDRTDGLVLRIETIGEALEDLRICLFRLGSASLAVDTM